MRGNCSECRITLTPVVTLGADDGPGAISGLSTMARLSDGRYVVSATMANIEHEMMVFDATGRFVRRVGTRGMGPGEYQFIRWLRASGDRLHVIDPRNRRETVLTSDFRFFKATPFNGSPLWDAIVLNDSTTLYNAVIRTRNTAGLLFHVFDERGSPKRSFGEAPGGYRFDVSDWLYNRSLATASAGGVWAAHFTRYQIDRWSAAGHLEETVVRDAEWFRPHAGPSGPAEPGKPLPPTIRGIREDAQGRLWVLIVVADSGWAGALEPAPRGAEGRYRLGDVNRAFDSIVEVIDVRTGRVLASRRFDQTLAEFIGDGVVDGYFEDAKGVPRIGVWQLSLQEPLQRARQ